MRTTFDFAALHYLNLWLKSDRRFCHDLTNGDQKRKLKAISDAAATYRVARTAPKKFDLDIGIPRFKPVLDIIGDINEADVKEDPVVAVMDIRDRISAQYGNREVLSLATKMLWLKLKSPIVIYDSQARKALGMKVGEYSNFYSLWQDSYDSHVDEIVDACSRLVRAKRYIIDANFSSGECITDLASQPWFMRRVFDVYLWHSSI